MRRRKRRREKGLSPKLVRRRYSKRLFLRLTYLQGGESLLISLCKKLQFKDKTVFFSETHGENSRILLQEPLEEGTSSKLSPSSFKDALLL